MQYGVDPFYPEAAGERGILGDKGPDTVIGVPFFGDYIKADVLI